MYYIVTQITSRHIQNIFIQHYYKMAQISIVNTLVIGKELTAEKHNPEAAPNQSKDALERNYYRFVTRYISLTYKQMIEKNLVIVHTVIFWLKVFLC